MSSVSLVFPNQLFEDHTALKQDRKVILVEEFLFFKQYRFHKQKIMFQRASMKFYESYLKDKGFTVEYIESSDDRSDVRKLIPYLEQNGISTIVFTDPVDDWLERRLRRTAGVRGIKTVVSDSPMFISSNSENESYFKQKKVFRQTDYYIYQRRKNRVLTDEENKPFGGKWTFDTENRKKYPAGVTPPETVFPVKNSRQEEAAGYVDSHFSENPGTVSEKVHYPVDFNESRTWMERFFRDRFHDFGAYQDAMVSDELLLNHSLLSPMMNSGLITAEKVIRSAQEYGTRNSIPLNSLEGFTRQILGWREFIRAVYRLKGSFQRTRNFWGFSRKLPDSFYTATTGIDPLDDVIRKVLDTGYCHHIERLMILGNFMLLCEIDPDEVYRWFMEMFIDSYDWVMVPNVYGMSQFADGGMMATKPYISGSNYIMKMSDYKKGEWQDTWDALFWRFIHTYREFFSSNPRLGLMVRSFDKMQKEKQRQLLDRAGIYLGSL